MMKRLLALLLLFCSAVQAQQVEYTYTQTPVDAPVFLHNLNQNQGTPLNLGDDQVSGPINIGFDFTFYGQIFDRAFISNNGVIGFQGQINGCCSGYNLANPGNRYGVFGLQTDLINIQTTNPWYRTEGEQGNRTFTVGWYDMPIFYDGNFRSSFEITLFESNDNIFLNYGDLNTGGRFFTTGLKGDDGEYKLLYSGTNDGFLKNSSYMFSPSTLVTEVNCSVTPGDPSCFIDDGIIDYTNPEELLASFEGDSYTNTGDDGSDSGSDDGSNDIIEDDTDNSFGEMFAEESEDITDVDAVEELMAEQGLEEMLSIEDLQESIEEGDDEKEENEERLADSIDPSILNLVLNIVESTSVVDNSGATAGASASSSTTSAAASSVDSGSGGISTVNFAAAAADVAETNINNSGNIVETFGENASTVESEIEALQIVNASLVASTSTTDSIFEDKTETDFPIVSLDPNNPLSQFVNNIPSIANQEAAGVLNNRQDKSDAELRAEQVVAANKEEQDAINANYMDADQSGIVVAMGSDVDFTSYRTASLQDANLWYMPEDIYKNIVLKDNVRGSYFLEKGSTDTYKKMVEEQYK